jgi:RNA polymerase sigma factor (sigma-70 family)
MVTAKNVMKEDLQRLIERAISGDESAFEQLYTLEAERILFHAYSILGDYHEAENAAQEVVIIMYNNIRRLRTIFAFSSWMQRIITNVCHSMRRGKKNDFSHYNLDDYGDVLAEEDKDFLPHEYAEVREQRERLKKLIDRLPENQKRCILMYYYDDMTYNEIAYAMDTTTSTVSTNLLKAKKRIKREMERSIATESGKEQGGMKSTSLPVITQVLYEKSAEEITPDIIARFTDACGKKLSSGSASHAHSGAKLSVLKSAVIITALTATITGGSIAGVNIATQHFGAAQAIEAVAQDYDISFANGGACSCGHLNPEEALLSTDLQQNVSVAWRITNADGGSSIYDGEGPSVAEPLSQLYATKADGDYTLLYTITGASGAQTQVERAFHIDTGEIQPGQYE